MLLLLILFEAFFKFNKLNCLLPFVPSHYCFQIIQRIASIASILPPFPVSRQQHPLFPLSNLLRVTITQLLSQFIPEPKKQRLCLFLHLLCMLFHQLHFYSSIPPFSAAVKYPAIFGINFSFLRIFNRAIAFLTSSSEYIFTKLTRVLFTCTPKLSNSSISAPQSGSLRDRHSELIFLTSDPGDGNIAQGTREFNFFYTTVGGTLLFSSKCLVVL